MTAGIPLNRTGSDNVSIPELVARARAGKIRIPLFQRAFEWNAADVRKLFDSIYRGFPIGTVILWRQPGPAGTVSLGPIEIEVGEAHDALMVVDGQQRITSLFGALSPVHGGVDERFEVYFRPGDGQVRQPAPRCRRKQMASGPGGDGDTRATHVAAAA